MEYFCLKPCRLSGKDYVAGDSIPDESIVPECAKALEEMGFIAVANETYQPINGEILETDEKLDMLYVNILNKSDEFDIAIPVPVTDIQAIFNVLQLNADDASEQIKNGIFSSSEALELLTKVDQRKAVRSAIKIKMEESGAS